MANSVAVGAPTVQVIAPSLAVTINQMGVASMTLTTPSMQIKTGAQIRAARALLGWRRKDLALRANLHSNAVAYWERHEKLPRHEQVGPRRIREALFCAGVVAVSSPAPGVCLIPRASSPGPRIDRAKPDSDVGSAGLLSSGADAPLASPSACASETAASLNLQRASSEPTATGPMTDWPARLDCSSETTPIL